MSEVPRGHLENEGSSVNPDLSIGDIRGAAEELKRKVASARLLKEQDIEQRAGEHEELNKKLQELREMLAVAQSTRDYFTTVKQAGELPPDSEAQLVEIEATVAGLENQLLQVEDKINRLASMPEILDRIHEQALKERGGEVKEAEMKQGVEELIKGNDVFVQEIDAMAQEKRKAREEYEQVNKDLQQLAKDLAKVMERARGSLEWEKHAKTITLLSADTTPEQFQQRRNELGILSGKEKAAIDIALKHRVELKRYHQLYADQGRLQEKINDGMSLKRAALVKRINEHMIKAWGIQEQAGITPDLYKGTHVAQNLYKDLDKKVEVLGGIEIVKKGEYKQEKVVKNDTPEKTALRELWYSLNRGGFGQDEITGYWKKPETK